MKLSQFPALLDAAAQSENERQARLIIAVNMGSHGKPDNIKREIERLLNPSRQKSLSVDAAMSVASQAKKPTPIKIPT